MNAADGVFIAINLIIFLAYLFIAAKIMPHFKSTRWQTKVGGVIFFLTCGLTHLELAAHAYSGSGLPLSEMTSFHMLTIHIVQVVGVWLFVSGLYYEFVKGHNEPFKLGLTLPDEVDITLRNVDTLLTKVESKEIKSQLQEASVLLDQAKQTIEENLLTKG